MYGYDKLNIRVTQFHLLVPVTCGVASVNLIDNIMYVFHFSTFVGYGGYSGISSVTQTTPIFIIDIVNDDTK